MALELLLEQGGALAAAGVARALAAQEDDGAVGARARRQVAGEVPGEGEGLQGGGGGRRVVDDLGDEAAGVGRGHVVDVGEGGEEEGRRRFGVVGCVVWCRDVGCR